MLEFDIKKIVNGGYDNLLEKGAAFFDEGIKNEGEWLSDDGNFEKAEICSLFSAITEKNPDAYLLLAQLYRRGTDRIPKNPVKEKMVLHLAVEMHSSDDDYFCQVALYELGNAYNSSGDFAKAKEYYLRANTIKSAEVMLAELRENGKIK